MLEKLNRILGIALIVTIIGVGILWIISPKHVTFHTSPTKFSREQKASKGMSEILSTVERLTTPDNQKTLKGPENPGLQDFVAAQPNSPNGMSQFLKSQGVELPYEEYLAVFTKMFQDQFPGEYAATLEPYMRERLAILAGEINASLENELSQEEFFEDVMVKFLIEEQNIPWMMTYFEGDFFAAARWARDILQNSIPPFTETFDTVTTDGLPTFPQRENFDITLEPPIEPQSDRNPLSKSVSTAIAGSESESGNTTDIDSGLMSTSPELSTEERFENVLRQQFSPERFNRAMRILNQHGSEEGIRRLKDSDPEIAKQLESFIEKKQEEN